MYVLYNKRLDKELILPKIGIWNTLDKKEAELMLESLRQYLISINALNMLLDFEIRWKQDMD